MAIKPQNLRKPFKRLDAFPLDTSSIFYSLDAADKYARGGNIEEETEELVPTVAYLGQIISVVEDTESGTSVQVYKIVVKTPSTEESSEVWGLALIGEGGGGGDGKVKDVQFNGTTFLNEMTGIANFKSDEIEVKNGKLHIKKIVNEQTTIF
jgi:hypothetical protein